MPENSRNAFRLLCCLLHVGRQRKQPRLMDLRDFISTALLDIIAGVKGAQAKTEAGVIVPAVRQDYKSVETGISELTSVEFEVSVRSVEKTGSEARLSVVAAIVGGRVKGESGSATGHVARLNFRVPIRLPVSK